MQRIVHQVKPAPSFGREGSLRLWFEKIVLVGSTRTLFGTLTGAAGGSKSHIKVTAEWKLKPQKNRFRARAVEGVFAIHRQDHDGSGAAQGVAADGLQPVGRIVAVADGNGDVAPHFGPYGIAKSIYFHFLARGHVLTFPADTPNEVQSSSR